MPAALPDGFDAATVGQGMVVSWALQEEVLAYAAVGRFWTYSSGTRRWRACARACR
jgi:hypothetical protein